MNAARTLAANVLAWIVLCAVVGWVAGSMPRRWLESDTFLTRTRSFERDGRLYEHLAIRRWKRRLPESNSLGGGKRPSKRTLTGRSAVPDYVVETRRAEYVHWTILLAGPSFFAWSPDWVARTMTLFGLAFNLPFIAVQRFNRARALRSRSAGAAVGARP